MISLPLKFDEVESVEEFVNMVKRLDYDVDVKIGRCVFDAKSLMSVHDDRRKSGCGCRSPYERYRSI